MSSKRRDGVKQQSEESDGTPIMDRGKASRRSGWLREGHKFPKGSESLPVERSSNGDPRPLTEIFRD